MPDPTPETPASSESRGAVDPPAAAPPHLLVMPETTGLPAIEWPGPAGQPAWAIPVTIPSGTRGYAVFLPLLPTSAEPSGTVQPTSTAGPTSTAEPSGTVQPTSTAGPTSTAEPSGTVQPAGTAGPTTGTGVTAASDVTDGGPTDAAAPPSDDAPGGPVVPGTPVPAQRSATPSAVAIAPTEAAPGDAGAPVTEATSAAVAGTTATTPAPATPEPGIDAATPARTDDVPPRPAPEPTEPRSATSEPATPPPTAAPPPGWPTYPGGPRPPHGVPYAVAPTYDFRSRPAPPSFLQTIWPGPEAARGWRTPAAVLAGALGVAVFVPLNRTGIGWFLGWLVLTVAVVVAVRRRVADLPRAERLVRAGWAAAALALLAVPAFRNAWWLVTFCVLGALGCAALAIIGGRLIRSILFSVVAAPLGAVRGLPWVRRHVEAPADTGAVRRVVGSVVATAVVLVVFGALLSSADAAFSLVLGQIIPEISIPATFRGLFLLIIGGLIAVAAVYTITAPPDLSRVDRPTSRRLGVVEWAPPIGALTALFVGFVAVQFTVLFGGEQHVLRTAGLSYAEYARSGFWQLVTVTLLTLAVLGGVTRWARRERRADRILLRVLLGLLSALSVVIVVSALSRMYTYQKVYSFTGERIFVMAFEVLLGAVFLMVLAAGIRWRGQWIPRLTVALAVAMLLSLAVLNPEDYAARRNVARYEQTGKIDAWYLRALSADATPALTTLPDPVRRCTLSWIADDLAEPDPWYAWNLGRTRARAALERVGPDAVGGARDCRAADQYDLPKTRR
ncbi:DUF4153 domain-containing protein [Micromonospora endolithica]|uniref:DUF4153 domain-containing protein n=1 Tax=Micromonospora endolithica TaxID=230091 RepID=UPI001EE13B87|nr:DUF4173 domain-containing protein [Micromonospora endolithica]